MPEWSPDGTRIACAAGAQVTDIYVMNADGSNSEQMTKERQPALWPTWSQDESKIASVRLRRHSGHLHDER